MRLRLRLRLLLLALVLCISARAREIRSLTCTITGGRATLSAPGLDRQPNRILIVTARVPEGVDPALDYGVFYDPSLERWQVAAVDGSPVHPDTRFHVAALDPGEASRHVAEPENSQGEATFLPVTDLNAVLLISPDLRGSSNPHPLALRYDHERGRWSIANRDGAPMPVGARFNVWQTPGEVVAATTTIRTDPEQLPFLSPRWSTGQMLGQSGVRGRSEDERSLYTVASRRDYSPAPGEYYNLVILRQEFASVASPAPPPSPPPSPPSPPERGPLIQAVDENRRPLAQIEVFLNNTMVGRTNNAGEFRLPAGARPSDVVYARRVAHVEPSYRRTGPAYRVYKTSYDPTFGQHPGSADITLGSAPVRVLRVIRPVIGVTLHGSVEWDATAADMTHYERLCKEASDYLYDATDGQFFLEKLVLSDDAVEWDTADYRIWANGDGRACCLPRVWGLVNPHPWSYVNFPKFAEASTWAHEFGHYGLCLLDEYHETPGQPPGCTFIGHTEGSSSFHKNKPRAACIMSHHRVTRKLCSGHPVHNSHCLGTRQGINCWTQIRNCYPYGLQGPAERGFVPGHCEPPVAFRTQVQIQNRDRGTPAEMRTWTVRNAWGNPVGGIPVWLESGGRSVFQGFSKHSADDLGAIFVHGAHLGDRLCWGNFGQNRQLTASDLIAAQPRLIAATRLEGLAQKPAASLSEEAGPLPLQMWLSAKGTVQSKSVDPSAVQMVYVGQDKLHPAGSFRENSPCSLRAQVGDRIFYRQAALFQNDPAPTVEGQAASNDGRVMLEFPPAWSGRVAISSGGQARTLPEGLFSGPYQLDWAGQKSIQPLLKFRLLDVETPPPVSMFRYDPAGDSWTPVAAKFVPIMGYLEAFIDTPGCYALLSQPPQPPPVSRQVQVSSATSSLVAGSVAGAAGDVVLLEILNVTGEKVYEGVTYPLAGGLQDMSWTLPALGPGTYRARLRLVDLAGNTLLSPHATFEVAGPPPPQADNWLTLTGVDPLPNNQFLVRANFSLARSQGVVFRLQDAQGNGLRVSPVYRCGPGQASVQWLIEDLQPNTPHEVRVSTEDGSVIGQPLLFVTPGVK